VIAVSPRNIKPYDQRTVPRRVVTDEKTAIALGNEVVREGEGVRC